MDGEYLVTFDQSATMHISEWQNNGFFLRDCSADLDSYK